MFTFMCDEVNVRLQKSIFDATRFYSEFGEQNPTLYAPKTVLCFDCKLIKLDKFVAPIIRFTNKCSG